MTAFPAQRGRAWIGSMGDQTVDVLADRGFWPNAIVARAGLPLRLVFRRRDADPCMDKVVFSSPHIDRRLARAGVTTVVLPAQPPGEVRFTCGMGRYHGLIELRSDRASSFAAVRAVIGRGLGGVRSLVRAPKAQSVSVGPPRSHRTIKSPSLKGHLALASPGPANQNARIDDPSGREPRRGPWPEVPRGDGRDVGSGTGGRRP